jgi:hypothetical protein
MESWVNKSNKTLSRLLGERVTNGEIILSCVFAFALLVILGLAGNMDVAD